MFSRRRNTTETSRPTLMTRLKGPNANHKTYKTEVTRHNGGMNGGGGGIGHTGRGNGFNQTSGTTAMTGTGPSSHHHHRRHHGRRGMSIGDKISNAMLRFRGNLSGRRGVRATGARHGHRRRF